MVFLGKKIGLLAKINTIKTFSNVQHTDKKEKKIFLICKEIQMGSGAMRKGFLIYEDI